MDKDIRLLTSAIESLTKEIVKLRSEMRPPQIRVEHLNEKAAPAMSRWVKWVRDGMA